MKVAAFDIGIKHFAWYIEEFCTEFPFGKTLSFNVVDISANNEVNVYANLINVLESIKTILCFCDYILIEKQFANRFSANVKALKLSSALCTWCLYSGIETKKVMFVNAKMKTGKVKIKKEYYRKQWCKERAIYILENRLDYKTLNTLQSLPGKITDITDCICYVDAFKSKKLK